MFKFGQNQCSIYPEYARMGNNTNKSIISHDLRALCVFLNVNKSMNLKTDRHLGKRLSEEQA
jgi:hypothetical protein